MFDHSVSWIGLSEREVLSGESDDQIAYLVTIDELATGWVEPDRHVLPDELESMPAGLSLAMVVYSVDRSRLNGYDVVRLLEAEARLEAGVTAEKLASVAEIAHCPPGDAGSPVERTRDVVDYSEAEVAAALSLTRRAATTMMDQALWLETGGHRVKEALMAGLISERKAGLFYRSLSHLETETVDHVLDSTLGVAPGLTTGQLGHRISRLVMTSDPDGANSSMREGLDDRKVAAHANPDFTGCFHVCSVPPVETSAALRHVDRIARKVKNNGDERTLDQLRADVALALLRGANPAGGGLDGLSGGSVHLTVPLVTLVDLADYPGDLAGYAPVIADIARQIALRQRDGRWTWTVTHDGETVATGTTRYRPTQAQKRQARADYPTCVHPGCRMPAINCDLDHRRPRSQGGRTHNQNLAPLCRYHHMMRHHTPWEYVRLPDGDHQWTSPLGHAYLAKRGPPEAA